MDGCVGSDARGGQMLSFNHANAGAGGAIEDKLQVCVYLRTMSQCMATRGKGASGFSNGCITR